MSLQAKNKWLTILVVVLLALNAATLALFWIGKTREGNQPPPPPPATTYLVKELGLDTTQQNQLKALIDQHRKAAELLRVGIKNAKDSLFELVKHPETSDSAKRMLSAAASSRMAELDLLTLDHFRQIRALCNPEQQKKFDAIIHEVIGRMGPSRPPPPPSGGPGRPEGPPPGPEAPPPPQPQEH